MKKFLIAVLALTLSFPAFSITSRSYKARADFAKAHPCPSTGKPSPRKCTGYIIDHVVPLCAGGLDSPMNMQWQTVAEAKAKDRGEKSQCAANRKAAAK